MATNVRKIYSLPPDLVAAVYDYADESSDPKYKHNRRPNESAVVSDAITLFLASKSINKDDKQTQSA